MPHEDHSGSDSGAEVGRVRLSRRMRRYQDPKLGAEVSRGVSLGLRLGLEDRLRVRRMRSSSATSSLGAHLRRC